MNALTPTAPVETIRPFQRADARAVADLFGMVMQGKGGAAPDELVGYFESHFLDGQAADPEIPSLVHVSADGTVDGFGGRVVQRFARGERILRAAIVGTLMVRDHSRTPMAGARLLKALMDGPQDLTMSETAGDASLAMWRQLRGDVLDRHSLDFIRVLKPARFGLELMAARIKPVRALLALAALPDRILGAKDGNPRWTRLPRDFRPERGVRSEPATPDAYAALYASIAAKGALAPVWPEGGLSAAIAEAMEKRDFGLPSLRQVVGGKGAVIGGYLFHFAGKGAARVTDIVHGTGQAGPVLDALFADAAALGASCVRGRATPKLLDALLGRRALFASESASVIAGRDRETIELFLRGEVQVNGLAGERWTRLIGDRFDP